MGASKVRVTCSSRPKKSTLHVFIDEIDAIGREAQQRPVWRQRRTRADPEPVAYRDDGFEGNTGVIILAATNRPDSLDPALTRPGRFDRRVPVELPDLKGREEILRVHAKKVKIAPGVDFNTVARMASGARRRAGQHCERSRPACRAGGSQERDPSRP